MLQVLFHAWERRLASVTTDRVVRPFDWGLDWIPSQRVHGRMRPPAAVLGDWVTRVMADTDAFFTPPPTTDYTLERRVARRRSPADVSERVRHAARGEQHRVRAAVSARGQRTGADRARRCSCCRNGTRMRAAMSACASCWR